MSVEHGCPSVLAAEGETALSVNLVNTGSLNEQDDSSLSKSEDQSVRKNLSGEFDNKGLNPSVFNQATANQRSALPAIPSSFSSPSNIRIPLKTSNLHPSNRDDQTSDEDYSPSAASVDSKAEELSSDRGSWQEAPASAKKKKRGKTIPSEEDEDETSQGQSQPSSLALGSPVLPVGLMRLKQNSALQVKNTIEHSSGSKTKRQIKAVSTQRGAKDQDQGLDEDIIEVFTLADKLSHQQVLRIIDRATVITCGGCDQIGRSYRKLKDLPPVLKCESAPCDKYVCGWCGLTGRRAFAGSRDQMVVHETKCPHRRESWNAAAKQYVSLRTESAVVKHAPNSKAQAQVIMAELKWSIKLKYQHHRRFDQGDEVALADVKGGLGRGGPNLDAGGNPSQKLSTDSSPTPKAVTRSGGVMKNRTSKSRTSAVLGLEEDVMSKAPTESRKFEAGILRCLGQLDLRPSCLDPLDSGDSNGWSI